MISVIVPVYKVEKYLDKCVQSILAQTYTDFELILVDDGSPDNCPQMCDEYTEKDERVKVIHKVNGGLSDARNAGTNIARGEFITYIDSDDYVSDDYLKTLWGLKEKYDADITVTGICTFTEEIKINNKRRYAEYCLTRKEAIKTMLYQKYFDTSACAILLPIDIALRHPFPVGKYHEDELTTYKFYHSVDTVAVTTKQQYYYLQRQGSIMHTFGQASIDELDAADGLVDFCRENYPDLIRAAMSKKYSDYCQVMLSVQEQNDSNVNSRINVFLKKESLGILKDSNCRNKNRLAALLYVLGGEDLIKLAYRIGCKR